MISEDTMAIPRPDHPALDAVESALDDVQRMKEEIERANALLALLKSAVTDRVLDLLDVPDRNERLRIVRYLYWMEKSVNSHALAAVLIDHAKPSANDLPRYKRFMYAMRRMVGPIGYKKCHTSDCENSVPIESRAELTGSYSDHYCDDCAQCPRRPVPCKNWQGRLATWEKQEEASSRARAKREADFASELAALKSSSSLDEDKLIRLYELMSHFDGLERWRRAHDE